MRTLLSQQEVADRWKVSKKSIENWVKDGILTPCKGVPVIRFTEEHILELEGVKIEKTSPLKYKQLEQKCEDLESKNQRYKSMLIGVFGGHAEFLKLMNED